MTEGQFDNFVHSPGAERLGFTPPSVLDGGDRGGWIHDYPPRSRSVRAEASANRLTDRAIETRSAAADLSKISSVPVGNIVIAENIGDWKLYSS
jgi:hypothetical protein